MTLKKNKRKSWKFEKVYPNLLIYFGLGAVLLYFPILFRLNLRAIGIAYVFAGLFGVYYTFLMRNKK